MKPVNQNTFDIKIGDEDREIFMSFGLLNELSRLFGDPTRVALLAADPDLRNAALTAVLATRKRSGKVLAEFPDIEDIDADYEDIEALLQWVADHVLGFFVRLLRSAANNALKEKEGMAALASSLTGSDLSPSKTE